MILQSPVKNIAAIHDLSGIGRTSLSAVIPILSSMGIKVCSLPTAVLSSHSNIEGYHFVDLTDHMQPIIDHWIDLKVTFNAIYSGFLGSHKQISIVSKMIDSFGENNPLVVIDPVLGDNGRLYGSMDDNMVFQMKSFIKKADIITPNLTEAALLLDKPFNPNISDQEIKEWIVELSLMGPKMVIITSVPNHCQLHSHCVIAYNKHDSRFWKVPIDYVPTDFPGTGDSFTSVLLGALLQGDSLPIALDRAVHFISYGARATFGYEYDRMQGILLERILNQLNTTIPNSSYQILP